MGAIPNFATEKELKRNFLDFNDVTLVVVDKSHLLLLGKFEYGGGPIFKVVLEC